MKFHNFLSCFYDLFTLHYFTTPPLTCRDSFAVSTVDFHIMKYTSTLIKTIPISRDLKSNVMLYVSFIWHASYTCLCYLEQPRSVHCQYHNFTCGAAFLDL